MSETINELSVPACERLLSVRGYHCGTVVDAGAMRDELLEAGLIGANGGLTIRGSAVAMKLQHAQLDALFGPE